jgi:hypothetical protein
MDKILSLSEQSNKRSNLWIFYYCRGGVLAAGEAYPHQ